MTENRYPGKYQSRAYTKNIPDLDTAMIIIESLQYTEAEERLSYVLHYLPHFKKLSRRALGTLMGLSRETTSKGVCKLYPKERRCGRPKKQY